MLRATGLPTFTTCKRTLGLHSLDLSEVRHPFRLALGKDIVGCDQVDQVEEAVEQETIKTFGEVLVQNSAVGQIHRA